MFSISTEVDDPCLFVNLMYKNDSGTEISFEPENHEIIINLNIEDSGEFDTSPSNGVYRFSWTPDSLCFKVGEYGDGNGVILTVKLPNTPEVLNSLKECLAIWKQAAVDFNEL